MGTFSIRFPYCGILHHMRNEWVLSSISHCMGKDRKAHLMKKAWEIGFRENPVKPIVCGEPGKLVLRFTSYGMLDNMWNTWVSQSISHSMEKCENHQIGRALEIDTHFHLPRIGTFLPSDSHLMVYFTTSEMHGFSNLFLITQENAANKVVFSEYYCFPCSKSWWF